MLHLLKKARQKFVLFALSCLLLSAGLLVLQQQAPTAHADTAFDMYTWTNGSQLTGFNGGGGGVVIDNGTLAPVDESLSLTGAFGPITEVTARGTDLFEQRGRFLFQITPIANGSFTPCPQYQLSTDAWCLTELDDNPQMEQVVAGGGALYQLHSNGTLWQYDGGGFHSWTEIDNNPLNVGIVANGRKLFLQHSDGTMWKYQGTPFSWFQIDARPNLTVMTLAGNGTLYELTQTFDSAGNETSGSVLQGLGAFSWKTIDTGHLTNQILASGSRLYQQRSNDSGLYIYDATNGGWIKFDQDSRVIAINVGANSDNFYKELSDGSIWVKAPQDSQYTEISGPDTGAFPIMDQVSIG